MPYSNNIIKPPTIIIDEPKGLEKGLQKIWKDIRNQVNGISGIGLVSRIGFPISTSFTSKEFDDDKCAAMVASVISVADRLGLEFNTYGPFQQSIFTNKSGFLLFYDIGFDAILFCFVKTESAKLGLVTLIEQLSSFIELTSDQKVYKGLSRHNYYAKN